MNKEKELTDYQLQELNKQILENLLICIAAIEDETQTPIQELLRGGRPPSFTLLDEKS